MKPSASPRSVAKRMVVVCEKLWKNGEEALRLANEAQSPVRARSYGLGRMGRGDVANVTADVGCARAEKESQHAQLERALTDLENVLIRVDRLVDRQFVKGDKRKARRSGSGLCVACGEFVPGEGEDRIKSGMCPKDYNAYHYARRKTGITRGDYIDEVKRERPWQPEQS